jgi:O-antigen/teichoic acid export membrane protein
MSNRRLLTRGVFFSYAALVAQISYSFLSVPLALSHLSTAQFGMWGLVSTIGSLLAMAELGMTDSFMRYLFECKDGKDPERYGRLFTASCLALGLVALVILAGGVMIAIFSAPLLGVPLEMRRDFTWVMLGASGMAAVVMSSKMLGVPLILHHRQDLAQIAQIGLFVIRLLVIFLAFRAGWGIYSLLAVEVAGIFWILPFNAWMSHRNGYYPKAGTFALPSRSEWNEIRNYSLSNFMIQIGGTVLIGLPQLLISSYVGLSAAGLWTVYTRVFGILKDIALRPFGIAVPMLIDFFVRGEVSRSVRRWGHVSQLVVAAAGLFFAVAAVNNSRFVLLWTGVESGWGLEMNASIAFYFLCFVVASCPYGVISLSKSFGIARLIPILQALVVAGIAYLVAKPLGTLGIILTASVGFLLGMLLFGMRQLGNVTRHNPLRIFIPAIVRPFLVTPLVFASAWAIERQTTSLPGYFGLFLSAGLACGIGLPLMAFLGVSAEVRGDLFSMVLKPIRRFFPAKSKPSVVADPEPHASADP